MPKESNRKEILMKKRLASKKLRDKIKNDPKLYEEQKVKNREKYNRRKREKKVVPINEMTLKQKEIMRKRNRDNFRAYYQRKKENKVSNDTTPEANVAKEADESEIHIAIKKEASETNDPLQSSIAYSPPEGGSGYNLRFRITEKNSDSTCIENMSVVQIQTCLSPGSQHATYPTSDSEAVFGFPFKTNDDINSLIHSTQTLLNNSNSSIPEVCLKSRENKPNLISHYKQALRRLKYKTKREINHLHGKIENLRIQNEKYRQQISRLIENNRKVLTSEVIIKNESDLSGESKDEKEETCGGGSAACGAGCTCGPNCACGDGKPSGGKPCCQGGAKK